MIEVTNEMVTAAAEAIEEEAIPRIGRDLGTIHRDDIVRAGVAAALAIVERDRCLKPRGHVFHPLARDLDREHAGLGLACTLCAGPCRIDDQPPSGTGPQTAAVQPVWPQDHATDIAIVATGSQLSSGADRD